MLDKFTRAYIAAALWSTNDGSTPLGGEPLDQNHDAADIAPGTMKLMERDCEAFQEYNKAYLAKAGDAEQNGHDFWLTRNGHGAGFWDRGYGKEVSDALCLQCKQYGEFDLEVGDDGLIHGR